MAAVVAQQTLTIKDTQLAACIAQDAFTIASFGKQAPLL